MAQVTRTPDQRIRERVPGDQPCGRLLFHDLEGELFFGAEPELEKHLAAIEHAAQGETRVVILGLRRARNPDAAFLNLLAELHSHLQRRDVALLLCGVQADLNRALADTGLAARLGVRHIFCDQPSCGSSIRDAIHFAYDLLGDGLCSACPWRQEAAVTNQPLDYVI
jgi:SulP family sulfate permease